MNQDLDIKGLKNTVDFTNYYPSRVIETLPEC